METSLLYKVNESCMVAKETSNMNDELEHVRSSDIQCETVNGFLAQVFFGEFLLSPMHLWT
jgi:hypothetical protein